MAAQSVIDTLNTLLAAEYASILPRLRQTDPFVTLDAAEEQAWFQRVQPVFDEYVKDKSSRGLPAAEVLAFVREWIRVNQK